MLLAGLAAAYYYVGGSEHRLAERHDPSFHVHFYDNPLPMYVVDLETLGFLDVNDSALRQYGYTPAEFRQLTLLDIRPAEDIPQVRNDLRSPRSAFREAGVWRHRRKDGSIVWAEICNHVTEWRGRKALVVVAGDVTEARRREEILRATEEMFRTAFEEAPYGMCLTGLEGRFLQANAALCRMLGYSAEELKGGAWEAITHPEDVERSRAAAARLMASPCEPVELVKRYICKQGKVIWARLKISTVMVNGQTPSHWIAHIEDISERKRTEEELVRAKEAAEAANRAKSQFLANISHEIRTPMNGIMGMTELALASQLNQEQRDFLDTVRTSSESLLELLNDILDFSKIEAGKFTLTHSEFDLDKTLQDTLRLTAVPAHEKGLELLYENRAEFPDRLLGDPGRLRQVVSNLLGDAIKFTSSGEVALIVQEAREQDGGITVHMAVADTGIGVAPEWKNRIFEAFVQADGSDTRRHGGTGLGLAICSRLVSYMGGRMWVESELGRGSVFHFTAHFAVPSSPPVRSESTKTAPLQGLNALVIDDSDSVRSILYRTLSRWQAKPVLAGSVAEAAWVVSEYSRCGEHFDVVLFDAHMADTNRVTAIDDLGAITGPHISMLTSLDTGSLDPELRASGHYVVKPVTPLNLRDTLLTALGYHSAAAYPHDCLSSAAALRPLHILLVEDNAINQKVAARLVEKLGHTVTVASNGAEALEVFERDQFDIVLMDVQMPVMNGYDATRAIRERERATRRRTPIVALTAHAMREDRRICLEAGMDDYLGKPIQSRELISVLERWTASPPENSGPSPVQAACQEVSA